MYFHFDKKVGFIAHPRTASSSTAHVLMQQMGFVIKGDHHAFDPTWNLNDWEFFCTVRNPFDVMVSWFYNQKREKPFSRWLPEFLDGCQFLQGERMFFGQSACKHIIHFENLQDDFDRVMHDVGLPLMRLPLRNVSARESSSFMGYYNPRTAKMVTDRFRQDFLNNHYRMLT